MMTTNPINSASSATKYFIQSLTSYYNEPEGESRWLGALAPTLNLSGNVAETDLSRVLSGVLPDGRQMGRKTEEGIKHRPGYELCFSVPKSVSIMALLGGDGRLKALTWDAVSNVLSFIESHYASTRVLKDGEIEFTQTDNLAAAAFIHPTSREAEPQLHVHALLANMTQTKDGVIRALATCRKGTYGEQGIEMLFKQQKTLGLLFRSELARLIHEKTNYQVQHFQQAGDCYFELKGVPDNVIKAFSTRRAQIEKQLDAMQHQTAKAAQAANQQSRQAKQQQSLSTLKEAWSVLADEHHFAVSDVMGHPAYDKNHSVPTELNEVNHDEKISVADCVQAGVDACLARSASFQLSDVINETLSRSFSSVSLSALESDIETRVQSRQWVKLENGHYSTAGVVHAEQSLLSVFKNNHAKPLCSERQFQRQVKHLSFPMHASTLSQLVMARSKNQCVDIESRGQRQLLQDWVTVVKSRQRLPIVIAPNRVIADDLKKTLGLPIHTVTTFSQRLQDGNFRSKQTPAVFFIETQQMHQRHLQTTLQLLSKKPTWSVVMTGSRIAPSTKTHGTLFHRAADVLPTICNQLDEADNSNKLAPLLLVEKRLSVERLDAFASHAVTLIQSGKQVGLFAPNAALAGANKACRQQLKFRGVLSRQETLVPALKSLPHANPLTHPDAYRAGCGWYLMQPIGVLKAYQWVTVISHRDEQVTLEKANGKLAIVPLDDCQHRPDAAIVYQGKHLAVAKGELLRAVIPCKKSGLQKGERFSVNAVTGSVIDVTRTHDNKRFQIDTHQLPFFDYDYVNPLSHITHQSSYDNVLMLVNNADAHCREVHLATTCAGQVTVITKNSTALTMAIKQLSPIAPKILTVANEVTPEKQAMDAVTNAIDLLCTQKAAFTRDALWSEVMPMGDLIGKASLADIGGAIEKKIGVGELLATDSWLVPQAMLAVEQSILGTVKAGQGACTPLMPASTVAPTHLRQEQTQLFNQIGQSTHRFMLLQGYPGVGKTYLLKAIKDNVPHTLIGLAVTRAAVREMEKQGVPSMTVARFMVDNVGQTLTKNHLVLIDEASQLDNHSMQALLAHVDHQDARCLLTGDVSQCKPIGAGNPLKLIFGECQPLMAVDIQRQKTVALKDAVKACINSNIPEAFAQLGERVIEVVEKSEGNTLREGENPRHALLASAWLQLSREAREQVLLPTLTNADRLSLCCALRDGLKNEGTLSGHSATLTALRPVHRLSTRYASSLKEKDILKVINRCSPSLQSGACYQLESKQLATNSLVLRPLGEPGAKPIVVTLPGNTGGSEPFSVFTRESLEVNVGERLRCTDNHAPWGAKKHDALTITHVHQEAMTAKLDSGKTVSLSMNEHHHSFVDYHYVFTVYGVQGKTSQKVLADFPSHPKNADITHFLVGLSRAVTDVALVTDSKENLKCTLQQSRDIEALAHPIASHLLQGTPSFKPPSLTLENPSTSNTAEKAVEEKNTSAHKPAAEKTQFERPQYNLERLNQSLTDTVKQWLPRLTDKPIKQQGNALKLGHKQGSLVVTTSGPKAGLWYDFATSEGGNMIQLIQHLDGKEFKDALELAGSITHQVPTISSTDLPLPMPVIAKPAPTPLPEKDQETLRFAEKIVRESVSVEGTLAETYLNKHRNISGTLPETLRFHPKVKPYEKSAARPALLGVVRDKQGAISRIQAVYLDEKTKNKAKCNIPKQTFGKGDAHGLHLGSPEATTIILCEGIETGLSLQMARPDADVIVAFGKANLAKVTIPSHATAVILAADNDGPATYHGKSIQQVVHLCKSMNKPLTIALPKIVGHDFNDSLKHEGVASIQSATQHGMAPETFEVTRQLHQSKDIPAKTATTHDVQQKNIASPISHPAPQLEHHGEYGVEHDM